MKMFFKAFLVLFLVMFIWGFFSGKSSLEDSETLKQYAFSKVKLIQQNKKYVFSYELNNKPSYYFDVDTNKLSKSSGSLILLESKKPNILLSSNLLKDPYLQSAFEAISFGIGSNELFGRRGSTIRILGKTGSSKTSNILKGIFFGVFPGYISGHILATEGNFPSNDSSELIKIVKNENNWKEFEVKVSVILSKQILSMSEILKDEKETIAFKKGIMKIYEILLKTEASKDIKSSDLEIFFKLKSMLGDRFTNKIEDDIFEDKILFMYAPWGVFILIFFALLLMRYKEKKVTKSDLLRAEYTKRLVAAQKTPIR